MLNYLISAVLQVLVFTLIPFLIFFIQRRSVKGFFQYIGLKKSNIQANLYGVLIMLITVTPLLVMILANDEFKAIMTDPGSVSGQIRQIGIGVEAFLSILIVAVIKTSLSEEIFFRGFVAKRIIAITNFQTGNILQALIFGIIHTLLFITITTNIFFLLVIFIFPAIGAYFKAYINEKMASGSIIPGWIAHASANIVSYTTVLLLI